jgi:hypothetical protein
VVGSNLTGAAKALLNILTLGSWYFYDVVYVMSSKDVVTHGFTLPFFEGMPIAQGMVTEKVLAGMEKTVGTISKVLFIIIMFTVAFFSWTGSSNTSGGWKTALTWSAIISGGIGILMIFMSLYSLYISIKAKVANVAGSVTGLIPGVAAPAVPAVPGAPAVPGVPGLAGLIPQLGGGRKTTSLQTIAQEMLDKRKANELPSESLLFMGILLTIALGGIAYAVFHYQKESKAKQDEASRIRTDTGTELGEDVSDTDGI